MSRRIRGAVAGAAAILLIVASAALPSLPPLRGNFQPTATPPPARTARIATGVKSGHHVFLDLNGNVFVPIGGNYLYEPSLFDVETFTPGQYSGERVENDFTVMQSGGYNSTRLFLWPTTAGNSVTNIGLDDRYFQNVADTLRRAKAHGIYPIISMAGLPSYGGYVPVCYTLTRAVSPPRRGLKVTSADYALPLVPSRKPSDPPLRGCTSTYSPDANWVYFSTDYIALWKRYHFDADQMLHKYGVDFDAILGFEYTGEIGAKSGTYPVNATGTVTTRSGTYTLPAQQAQMIREGITSFINEICAYSHTLMPTVLCTAQIQPRNIVGGGGADPVLLPNEYLTANANVDFWSVSFYETDIFYNGLTVVSEYNTISTNGAIIPKPVLSIEHGWFFGDPTSIPSVISQTRAFMSGGCALDVFGWSWYTWPGPATTNGGYHAMQENGIFAGISPAVLGDFCGTAAF